MKTKIALLLSLLLGISSTPVSAAECTSSFYCYGNTANTVSRVATRPPPIPPPNPRVVQQRRQAQLALRNSRPITPRIARPAATPAPAPQRITPVARPTPRAMPIPTPQRIIPAPQRVIPAPNRVASNCQSVTAQASVAARFTAAQMGSGTNGVGLDLISLRGKDKVDGQWNLCIV